MCTVYEEGAAHAALGADRFCHLTPGIQSPRKSWCFSSSPKAGKRECLSLKAVRQGSPPTQRRSAFLFYSDFPLVGRGAPTLRRPSALLTTLNFNAGHGLTVVRSSPAPGWSLAGSLLEIFFLLLLLPLTSHHSRSRALSLSKQQKLAISTPLLLPLQNMKLLNPPRPRP